MDPFVFAAVLFAAACHAGWNATIKRGLDPLATTVLISIGAAIVSALLLPVVGLPAMTAWPWCVASVLIHLVYFAALIESYRAGDMGQVYPIARGSAPLMTATATTVFIGERLGLLGWCGISLLVAGVVLLSLRGGREAGAFSEKVDTDLGFTRDRHSISPKSAIADLGGFPQKMRPTKEARARFRLNLFETRSPRLDRRAVGFALFTAVTICAYSVVDGVGARLAGSANAYSVALFAGIGPVMASYALARRGREVIPAMARRWRIGLAGGGLQLGSYGIAIWAMTVAPIAIVAALRETSVLFGAAIAVAFLKEPLRPGRVVAALMIVAGLTLIRLY
jgi:drug/metabolite transporter (DMT)-like permease